MFSVSDGQQVQASIRPEDVEVFSDSPENKDNLIRGTIAHKAYLGNFLYFFVEVDHTMIRIQAPHFLPQQEGEEVFVRLNPEKCMILA